MDILKCSFAVTSTEDAVNQVGGAAYTDTTVNSLVSSNPQFWLEADTNGNTHLCTAKVDGASLFGVFTNAGGGYSLKAVNFEVVELVGGRPATRPHAY